MNQPYEMMLHVLSNSSQIDIYFRYIMIMISRYKNIYR